jgi:hypothetical protein
MTKDFDESLEQGGIDEFDQFLMSLEEDRHIYKALPENVSEELFASKERALEAAHVYRNTNVRGMKIAASAIAYSVISTTACYVFNAADRYEGYELPINIFFGGTAVVMAIVGARTGYQAASGIKDSNRMTQSMLKR